MFWHRPKCLEQVLDSPDARDRRAAAKDLKEDGANLSARLRINPSSLFSKHCTDYMTQMFEVYAEDVRPEVRKAACGYLRSFAPQQADEHCK
jgi:hypothetical protein